VCGSTLKYDELGFVFFQTLLKSVSSEITLQNKVIDLAVYGHLVTTLEHLQLAVERNGVLGLLGKLRTLLSLAKVGSHILFTEKKE
jgi:hypothetical protein